MKSAFYGNNLTLSIIDIKYNLFIFAPSVYSTDNSIYLTLFPSPFTDRVSTFSLPTFFSDFDKILFIYLFIYLLIYLFCFIVTLESVH